jgi:hypothetical protein
MDVTIPSIVVPPFSSEGARTWTLILTQDFPRTGVKKSKRYPLDSLDAGRQQENLILQALFSARTQENF